METSTAIGDHRQGQHYDPRARRVWVVWALLFFNVLNPGSILLVIPHRVAQLITQGAWLAAVVLALTINPRMRIRPNWFLGLYTLLAVSSLMMSVRLVGLGSEYRSIRLLGFLSVLWLLTPWWGRRDLLLMRSQLRFLLVILASVALSALVMPGKEFSGRLSGILWSIPATQIAHYSAEVVGLMAVLWMCRLVSRRLALMVVVPGLIALVLTHTRTALVAMLIAVLAAGASLFLSRRRVRRTIAIMALAGIVIIVPASPFVVSWLARGESGQQLTGLTGRTQNWEAAVSVQRPALNTIFGSGLTNDAVTGSSKALNGLAIDSSWVSIYQDQGVVGEVIVGMIFLLLLVTAFSRARGPTRALALFLIVYCLIAGITESGLGGASPYLLDLSVAASLLAFPSATASDLTFGLRLPELHGAHEIAG